MSVLATTVSASTIGNADVGTATTGDNTTKIASGAFLINTFNALNYVLNYATSYVITGIKTFTSGMPLTSGTNPLFPITIGAVRASIVDVKPVSATTNNLLLMGQTQNTSANFGAGGTNVFRNPMVVRKTVDGLGVDNTKNRMLNGSVTATPAGATVTFSPAFTDVPLVFLTTNVATPVNVGSYDVTASGFKAYSVSNAFTQWFAIGR
jgi:hypothetical protein